METVRAWAKDLSKLNSVELIKLKKDGFDIIQEIVERFANDGFEAIPEEDKVLLKWAGVYQQKPKNGYLMMRITIPSGFLTSKQARALADISRDYGKNHIDLTTRQSVQLHWVTMQSLPDIFQRLADVNLSSFGACGDCTSPIVGSALAGIDPDELMDTTPILNELHQFFYMNRDFSNLPRKFKIAIFANPYNSGNAEIHDLAFTPASQIIEGKEELGFHVWVGGGLSARAHMAKQLDLFVRPEEVGLVAASVLRLYRDNGYREKRNRARLRFLVADWGVERFQEELLKLTGRLLPRGTDKTIGWNAGYYFGVHKQKQPGLHYVGMSIPIGRFTADDLEELARIADLYGDGHVRLCNSKNIVLPNIPDERLEALLEENLVKKYTPYPKAFTGHSISCTGTEYCNYAIVETKSRMLELANYLDDHIEQDVPIRIHMTGCPNSCGQRQIADIGLQAALIKTEEGMKEAFDIYVGGSLGPEATFNSKLNGRIPAANLPLVLTELVQFYNHNRVQDENFHHFVQRVGLPAVQHKLDSVLPMF